MRLFHIVISLVCVTIAAVGLAYAGITLSVIYSQFHRDDVAVHAAYSMAAGVMLPLFFLGVGIVASVCLLIRTVRKLFNPNVYPDYF
jgi:hypothetical protein